MFKKKIVYRPDSASALKIEQIKHWIYNQEKVWLKDEDVIQGALDLYHYVSEQQLKERRNQS